MPAIDRDQVQKVAHLARLQLTPEEEVAFTTQLSSILEYFEQLSELDIEDVQPTTRAVELSNIMRPDTLEPFPGRQDLLEAAPDRDDDFFRVPQILDSTD